VFVDQVTVKHGDGGADCGVVAALAVRAAGKAEHVPSQLGVVAFFRLFLLVLDFALDLVKPVVERCLESLPALEGGVVVQQYAEGVQGDEAAPGESSTLLSPWRDILW
jgi:hypothetical protein